MPLLKSSIPPFKAHATRNRKWAEQATDPAEKAKFLKTAEEYEARVAEIENSLSDESDPLSTDSIDSNADSIGTAFGLERDLQAALRNGIGQLEDGLQVLDGGSERVCPSGRIDILAQDRQGTRIVIELKTGTADRGAVSQVLSYVGDLMNEDESVRGIIVAEDFAPSAISAARAGNVRLYKYSIKFSFERLGAAGRAMP
jgi:RecB family endonuclease NucS